MKALTEQNHDKKELKFLQYYFRIFIAGCTKATAEQVWYTKDISKL
jgi:hypothetical protein